MAPGETASSQMPALVEGVPPRAARVAAAAGAVAAVGAVGWLLWWRSRQPRASKEEVVETLKRLKDECASVYAEATAAMARAGPPSEVAAAAAAAAWRSPPQGASFGSAGEDEERDDPALKLRQAVEQPLVLTGALQEAAERTAAELLPGTGGDAAALEEELRRFEGEPEVQLATEELRAMHEACVQCREDASLLAACTSECLWEADAALDMLRELGQAKVEAFKTALKTAPAGPGSRAAAALGPRALEACMASEDLLWEQKYPGDRARRLGFAPALARLQAKDRAFRLRRATIERELDSMAAPSAAAVTHKVLAAF